MVFSIVTGHTTIPTISFQNIFNTAKNSYQSSVTSHSSLLTPNLWQEFMYFPPLWLCLFWAYQMGSCDRCLCVWFLLLSMSAKFIRVVASINMPFCSIDEPHSIAWICCILFIHHQLIGNWIVSSRKRESANFLLFQDGFGSSVSHICILILGSACQFLQKEHPEFW